MKHLLIISLVLFSIPAFSQSGPIALKWKLQPGEILTYKTTMDEIDTTKDRTSNFDGLFSLMGDTSSSKPPVELQKALNELRKDINHNMITHLYENKKGSINIEMEHVKTKADEYTASKNDTDITMIKDFSKMVETMNNNIMLRGVINKNGTINSFYVKNEQKNLIAMLFQLPGKDIKVGDSWPIDVNLISMDDNFNCDTASKKNTVTLVDIKQSENDSIAVIKYDILEYVSGDFNNPFRGNKVKTMMKMGINAIAEFSISKGRWVSYNGVMLLDATGLMEQHSKTKVSLVAN